MLPRRIRPLQAAGLLAALFLTVFIGPEMAPKAQKSIEEMYVRRALVHLDAGIQADNAQWRHAREEAVAKAAHLEDIDAAYALLDRLARLAGGPHSSFTPPEQTRAYRATDGDHAFPVVDAAGDGIGLIRLPGFASDDLETMQRYTDAGVRQLTETASAARCGWVLDLRGNSGGSVYSILGAVTPLIDDGPVLSYAYPDGRITPLTFEGGRILAPDGSIWSDSTLPFPQLDSPRIAILQDRGTISAGEAVIVALTGQQGVRSFGRATRGFPSVNDLVQMEDGAILAITVAHDQDRFGKIYDSPIPPNEISPSYDDDMALAKAWLMAEC